MTYVLTFRLWLISIFLVIVFATFLNNPLPKALGGLIATLIVTGLVFFIVDPIINRW